MDPDILVKSELDRPRWDQIREANGMAIKIPSALRELLAARSAEEVTRAYWKLENHVVVNGQLFESAAFVVPVLMAALVKFERPSFVRAGILELLFQIVHGEPHQDEIARGRVDLGDRCRQAAREGLWLLYREFLRETHVGAREVLGVLAPDKARLVFLEHETGHKAEPYVIPPGFEGNG